MDTITPMESPKVKQFGSGQHPNVTAREFPPSVKYSMSSGSLEQIAEESKQAAREGESEPDEILS